MNSWLEKAEKLLTKWGFGLLVSIVLLFGASNVTTVNQKTAHHGNEYTMLSEHPFDFAQGNDLQLRILSPLAGYLLFMRGPLFSPFMIFVLLIFFSVTYVFLRNKSIGVINSILVNAVLAFSTLVFYQFYFPAYTDPGSFLLIICLMMFYQNRMLSTILLSLLLFNHESNLFLFPFFFLLLLDGEYSWRRTGQVTVLFVLACIPYFAYREYIVSHIELNFTVGYYLDSANMRWTREHVYPNLANGIFQSFRLAWLIPFAGIVIDIYEKRTTELLLILSAIVFVMLQFFIAYDISRLAGLAFPSLIISAVRLNEFFGARKSGFLLITIFILNLFIPAYCVGALDPIKY
jgi:hypothetical protein